MPRTSSKWQKIADDILGKGKKKPSTTADKAKESDKEARLIFEESVRTR
jgi:hypothetical protein